MDTIRNLRICALNSRYYSKICDIILTIPIPPDLIDTPYKNWKYFTESIKRLDELYSDRDRVILRLLLYIVHGGDSYHVDEFLSWAVGLKKEYKNLLKNLRFAIYKFRNEWDKKKTPISAISRKIYRVLYRKNLLDYFEEYIEPIMHICYGLELKDLKEINNNIEKLTIDQVKLPVTGEDIQKYIKHHPYNFNNAKDNYIIGNINKYLLDLYDENPKMTREDLLDEMKNIKL